MRQLNEDGVHPVVGVILMVAITVIVASVIAAFVFGMAGNVQKEDRQIKGCIHETTTVITYHSGLFINDWITTTDGQTFDVGWVNHAFKEKDHHKITFQYDDSGRALCILQDYGIPTCCLDVCCTPVPTCQPTPVPTCTPTPKPSCNCGGY